MTSPPASPRTSAVPCSEPRSRATSRTTPGHHWRLARHSALPRTWPLAWVLAWFLLLSVPCPAKAPACEEIDPVDLVPDDAACAGIVRDGEPIGAYSLQELMAIINGGALLYDQYGFVAAAFQNFTADVAGQTVPVMLSAFNQGSAQNAAALYQDPGSGSGEPVPDWQGNGEARFRVDLLSSAFEFHEECFFASVMVLSTDQAAYDVARCLADEFVVLLHSQLPVTPSTWGELKTRYRD